VYHQLRARSRKDWFVFEMIAKMMNQATKSLRKEMKRVAKAGSLWMRIETRETFQDG
jgi:predicted amino acid-binding ACT domain protein